jgi:hypothetical protein
LAKQSLSGGERLLLLVVVVVVDDVLLGVCNGGDVGVMSYWTSTFTARMA